MAGLNVLVLACAILIGSQLAGAAGKSLICCCESVSRCFSLVTIAGPDSVSAYVTENAALGKSLHVQALA